jgi:hypothetical protein
MYLDDSIAGANLKQRALQLNRLIQKDLKRLGFIMSE